MKSPPAVCGVLVFEYVLSASGKRERAGRAMKHGIERRGGGGGGQREEEHDKKHDKKQRSFRDMKENIRRHESECTRICTEMNL